MKKIIIAIIIFLGVATSASAFYSDNALVSLWNSRRDLQKAFPGDPTNNAKLETWAKKYGWKETPDLYNYYPDKAIVEKIVEVKTNERIAALENQVAALTAKVNQLQGNQLWNTGAIISQQTATDGKWRNCLMNVGRYGQFLGINCELIEEDAPLINSQGKYEIKFYTK